MENFIEKRSKAEEASQGIEYNKNPEAEEEISDEKLEEMMNKAAEQSGKTIKFRSLGKEQPRIRRGAKI